MNSCREGGRERKRERERDRQTDRERERTVIYVSGRFLHTLKLVGTH